MPSKTISVSIDAYARLRATRRPGESFSSVITRVMLPPPKATARDLAEDAKAGRFGRGVDWAAVSRAVRRHRRPS